jgi:hypothetical protein
MTDQARSDGLRLLHVMNETQARGSDKVPVTPAIAARTAGLEEGSDRYGEAVRFLRDEGALVEDDQFTGPVGDYEHGGAAYTITRRGFEMLEDA